MKKIIIISSLTVAALTLTSVIAATIKALAILGSEQDEDDGFGILEETY